MYNPEDILILGDSFCFNRLHPGNWPYLLARRFIEPSLIDGKFVVRGEGFSGASWWSVRVRLLRELEQNVPKILIFAHTEPNRIPSNYDFPLNTGTVEYHTNEEFSRDHNMYPGLKSHQGYFDNVTANATLQYYKYLHSLEYSKWAQKRWFEELDSILEKHPVPIVIHMHCFHFWFDDNGPYIFKNGITSKEVLFDLSEYDNKLMGVHKNQCPNHFSEAGNYKIYKSLAGIIENFDPALNGTIQDLNLYRK